MLLELFFRESLDLHLPSTGANLLPGRSVVGRYRQSQTSVMVGMNYKDSYVG